MECQSLFSGEKYFKMSTELAQKVVMVNCPSIVVKSFRYNDEKA